MCKKPQLPSQAGDSQHFCDVRAHLSSFFDSGTAVFSSYLTALGQSKAFLPDRLLGQSMIIYSSPVFELHARISAAFVLVKMGKNVSGDAFVYNYEKVHQNLMANQEVSY